MGTPPSSSARCAGSVGAGRVRPSRVEIGREYSRGGCDPGTTTGAFRRIATLGADDDLLAHGTYDRPASVRRPWGDLPGDDPKRDAERAARDALERQRERMETAAELDAAGIDLSPAPPGMHRHGDQVHASDHAHPHQHAGPGEPPLIGIVGAGAVGTALGVALSRAGWRIHAVASRDRDRRERFRGLVDGVRAFPDAQSLVEEVELIIVAVPDDALAPLARSVRMYGGQAMIHTSGALGAEVLLPAMAAGTQIGSFHPLVAFADTERAVEALRGATVAIEGDDQLLALLAEMAEALGATPVRLAPGSKAAYHAAAVLAAGGFVALLDAIAELGTGRRS